MTYDGLSIDDFRFSRFGFIVRTNAHTDTHRIADAAKRFSFATVVGVSNRLSDINLADLHLVPSSLMHYTFRLLGRPSATYSASSHMIVMCTVCLRSSQNVVRYVFLEYPLLRCPPTVIKMVAIFD